MFTKYRAAAIPPHAYGKYRRDPLMLLATIGYDALHWLDRFTATPAPSPSRAEFFDVVVTDRAVVAHDEQIVALTFARPGGDRLPAWSAGAHVDVVLPSGTVRQYSLCGDLSEHSRYRIAVRLIPDGRGGSAEVHRLNVGAALRISAPRNAFPLAVGGYNQPTTSVRFIAAGIGITPILPMLDVMDRVSMPWSMIYCGRSRESIALVGELERFGDRVSVRCDDEHGIATAEELLGELTGAPAVYTCGPPPMIEMLRAALADRRDVEFHYERFSAAPVVDGRPFGIRQASTGEVVEVGSEQTALEAILRVRSNATYSCQQGFCRSCAVRVLDGVPDHRSDSLTPAELEAGYFLPCVSRSDGCLTIDL